MADDEVEVHPLVRALLGDVSLAGGRAVIDDETLASWRARLADIPDGERSALASHIVAGAVKLHRMGGEAAGQAIARLCELTAFLIGNEAAAAVFEASDLPAERYAKVLGSEAVLRGCGTCRDSERRRSLTSADRSTRPSPR